MLEVTDENLIRHTLQRFNKPGAADRAIRETFGLSNPRYWQAVVAIVGDASRVRALPCELWPAVKRIEALLARAG